MSEPETTTSTQPKPETARAELQAIGDADAGFCADGVCHISR
ncbi:MAG: hypothetical protein ACRDVZ_00420 [Jiangellaceae bacterium]